MKGQIEPKHIKSKVLKYFNFEYNFKIITSAELRARYVPVGLDFTNRMIHCREAIKQSNCKIRRLNKAKSSQSTSLSTPTSSSQTNTSSTPTTSSQTSNPEESQENIEISQ
jgi:hypothetical protein